MAENVTLRDADIRPTYDTMDYKNSPALDAFYIPVLSVAKKYRRLSGYFSSTSLAVAAKGIAALIANNGEMELICSPVLSPDDVKVLSLAETGNEEYQIEYFNRNFKPSEDSIREDHLSALGWMLANGRLKIKIAWVVDSLNESKVDYSAGGIFHMKTGIVEDVLGNVVAFSGSNNETASGWVDNVEQFDVYKSWIDGQLEHLEGCCKRFDDAWNNRSRKLVALDIPAALRKGLEQRASCFDREKFVAKYYKERQREFKVAKKLSLRPYQKEAIAHWKNNDFRSLFEMATGTGKTRTAIACISEIQKIESKLLVVISSPQIHLSDQWRGNCVDSLLNPYCGITCDSTNPNWINEAARAIAGLRSGFATKKTIVLFVTHDTVCSKKFKALVSDISIPILFIGDEVHGLGAENRRKAFLDLYRYRIGLSATPDRWFDDAGTDIIKDFFGNNSYVLTIADALRHQCVCQYRYHPVFIDLSNEELDEYRDLTDRIVKIRRFADCDDDARIRLDRLLQKRADIIKNASEKICVLAKYVNENPGMKNTLVFCSPQQLDQVKGIFAREGIIAEEYTYRQSAVGKNGCKSERKQIVDRFVSGKTSAIIAIKCLDEGIDIPSADNALLVSSSTNPREYIQRIGRVIRVCQGKRIADIHDFIVRPLTGDDESKELYLRELRRAYYIAENSFEPVTAIGILRKELENYGL